MGVKTRDLLRVGEPTTTVMILLEVEPEVGEAGDAPAAGAVLVPMVSPVRVVSDVPVSTVHDNFMRSSSKKGPWPASDAGIHR